MRALLIAVLAATMAAASWASPREVSEELRDEPVASQATAQDVESNDSAAQPAAETPASPTIATPGPAIAPRSSEERRGAAGRQVLRTADGGEVEINHGRVTVIRNFLTRRTTIVRRVGLGTKGHRALWADLTDSGVVSRGFVEARDEQVQRGADAAAGAVLRQSKGYTDSQVGKVRADARAYADNAVGPVAGRAWWAILLALCALAVAVVALLRHQPAHPATATPVPPPAPPPVPLNPANVQIP